MIIIGYLIIGVILIVFMCNWLRKIFCKHDFERVKQNEYPTHTSTTFICKKCGYIRKVRD